MSNKAKKPHKRISQWQFLLCWIGGQFVVFFILATMGILSYFMSMSGILGTTIAGVLLGWFIGWVQQWSIYKHFGRYIKGWRTISAIFTGITLLTVQSSLLWLQLNFNSFYYDSTAHTVIMAVAFMITFGIAGIGQAVLLRKHIRHSWLFLLSALVGGVIHGIPVLGASSFFLSQIAQYTVTAFTIIWLFQMSGSLDNIVSEDEAIERLHDTDYADNADYIDNEQHKKRDTLFENLFNMMRLVLTS